MTPEDLALATESKKEIAECLGVNPSYGDDWIGRFRLKVGAANRDCELYSTVLHIGDDTLHLMSHQILNLETGKAYLVDFFGPKYIVRILRMIDPETQMMTITIGMTVGGVVQSTEVVNITFVKE
jgi:hypothetical protein